MHGLVHRVWFCGLRADQPTARLGSSAPFPPSGGDTHKFFPNVFEPSHAELRLPLVSIMGAGPYACVGRTMLRVDSPVVCVTGAVCTNVGQLILSGRISGPCDFPRRCEVCGKALVFTKCRRDVGRESCEVQYNTRSLKQESCASRDNTRLLKLDSCGSQANTEPLKLDSRGSQDNTRGWEEHVSECASEPCNCQVSANERASYRCHYTIFVNERARCPCQNLDAGRVAGSG